MRFFRGQEKLQDLRVEHDLEKALQGTDAVILSVRHKHYMNLIRMKLFKALAGRSP
jgi:UDP-N-acetyl-D-mannosaminuronate dehydrogenase